MSRLHEVKVPDIGDFDVVDVVEVLVKKGDRVVIDDPLITLESDKASMEVPSPVAGRVEEIKVAVGDQVGEGALIVIVAAEDDAPPSEGEAEPSKEKAAVPSKQPEASAAPPKAKSRESEREAPGEAPPDVAAERDEARARVAEVAGGEAAPPRRVSPTGRLEDAGNRQSPPHASPSVRRFARELGVELGGVEPSGPRGRILAADVQVHVKERMQQPEGVRAAARDGIAVPEIPAIDFSKFGPVEEQPMSRIRRKAAANLHRSWLNIPRVSQFEEADVTELEAFRKELKGEADAAGVKLTPLPFVMKAVVAALREHPDLNASLHPDGDKVIRKGYYHLGIAVDTKDGLIVPVVRDVDQKGLLQVARELAEVSARARDGKLQPRDLQGAGFTISSLGAIGGTGFTPIINPPEVAILGVSRSQWRPVWDGSAFVPRLMLPFTVVYDHRVVDGATAGRFAVTLAGLLSDVRRLLL